MNKKLFCLAPWVYSHVDMIGNRALCCQSEVFPLTQNLTLEEFWNSPNMKEARSLMMEGKAPLEYCNICLNSTLGSDKPLEMFSEFSNLEEELIERTEEDGTFKGKPFFYDYRISNDCNLSCRMCCPEASSKIENGVLNISSTTQEEKDRLLAKKNQNINQIIPEILGAIKRDEVRELYFASGEAILQNEFWSIIDYCIERDVAKKIGITYHTNLSLPLDLMKKHFKKLNKFRRIKLIVSVDGEGESGEFIRDGLRWNRFIQNLEYTINKSIQEFAITLTIPTLLNIKDFLKFLYHYKLKFNVNICHVTGQSGLLSPLSLTRDALNQLVDHALSEIGSYVDPEYFMNFIKVLHILKKTKLAEDNNSQWKRDYFLRINKCEELDHFFKRQSLLEYYKTFPITREWIRDIRHHGQSKQLEEYEREYLERAHSKYICETDVIKISHRYGVNLSIEELLELSVNEFDSRNLVSLIGSAPTFMNKFLSPDRSNSKYKLFNDFQRNLPETLVNYPQLKVLESEYIGIFSFLFRRNKGLKKLSSILDLFTWPLRFLTSFHYYVLLEVKEIQE